MKLDYKDIEIQCLVESGKSHKYKTLPDKKNFVGQLKYVCLILSALSDISEITNYKSIYNNLIHEADGLFLLPINGKSGMALRMSQTGDTIILLELISVNNYEQGR